MIVVPDTFSLAELVALVGVGGALNGAKLHLFKNAYTPTRGDTVASFTPADFTGYATSAALVWGAPYTDPANGPQVVANAVQFTSTGPFLVGNDIYGVYCTDAAGTTLLFAEAFTVDGTPTPVIIAAVGQAVVYVPVFGAVAQAA